MEKISRKRIYLTGLVTVIVLLIWSMLPVESMLSQNILGTTVYATETESIQTEETANVMSASQGEEEISAQIYQQIYDDAANLITVASMQDQIKAVMNEMTDVTNVIFATDDTYTRQSAEEKCESYVASLFGTGKTEPVVMFLIDMDNREIYMYCTGHMTSYITDGEAYTITDNVYSYASAGNYGACAIEAFTEANQLIDGYAIRHPMKTINNLLIALFLGFLGTFLYMLYIREKYRDGFAVKKRRNKITADIKLKTKRTLIRSYDWSESSGSGGSGGSGGSSGYSGGGGGGGFSGGGGGGGSSSGGGHSF